MASCSAITSPIASAVGLHICYELRLAATIPEAEAASRVRQLHDASLDLPFARVSDVVRLTHDTLGELPKLRGLAFQRLEDVAHLAAFFAREELYSRATEIPESGVSPNDENGLCYHSIQVPPDVETVAYGFGIAVGSGSEPAALGVVRICLPGRAISHWSWHCCCKTQYASVHGNDNLVRCHHSIVAALEAAQSLGFEVTVRDETGYWESRDAGQLIHAVTEMNKLVATLAGRFTDAARDAGVESRAIESEIFKHPDFERLEGGD